MKKKYIWGIVAVLVLAGGYYWYSKSSSVSKEVSYVTEKAQKGSIMSSVSASGSVIVDSEATIDPTIDGTVADLSVKVGDSVKKGDFLFNIINNDLGVSVAKGAASYESAKNSLESAKIDAKEAEENYDNAKEEDEDDDDAYTKDELRILKDKIGLADDKVVQAQKSLSANLADYRNMQSDASERKVVSSISGTVLEVNIKNGDDLGRSSANSSSNETPIIIGDLQTLKAEVSVNEVDIADVSIGQKVRISLDAISDEEFSGEVEKIDSLGTTTSGVVSYNVVVGFSNLSDKIKPSMSVSAKIILAEKNDTIVVPSGAVETKGSESSVKVLVDGKPQSKVVRTGLVNDTMTEILSGVSVGDEIVTQEVTSSSSSSSSSSLTSSSSSSKNRSSGLSLPGLGGPH
jgi:RND family efflux transporter MFP subunit